MVSTFDANLKVKHSIWIKKEQKILNSKMFFEMKLPSLLFLLFYIVHDFLHILIELQNFEHKRIYRNYAAHMFPLRVLLETTDFGACLTEIVIQFIRNGPIVWFENIYIYNWVEALI